MKICNLLPVFSLFFFVACGSDSSGVNGVDPETSSSSEELVETSSSFEKGKSSSSVTKKSSSSTAEENKSSSSKAKVSSSSKVDVPSSSSAKSNSSSSSADVVLTDPIEIFKPRVPKMAAYHCTYEEGRGKDAIKWELDFDQQDWICTFKYADKEGFVYVQGSPTDCEGIWWPTPVITADTAILYVNKKYIPLTDLTYEWGGNHHSDRFRFTYDGKVYEYHHSSIGAAYRPCQEMDCMRVYKSDGETLIEDGCGTDEEDVCKIRTLPVVCRFADENGEFGDFTDTFKPCGGDNREF